MVDSIAIAASLALTALIMLFLGYFLWRAQYRSATMSVSNAEMGQVSLEAFMAAYN